MFKGSKTVWNNEKKKGVEGVRASGSVVDSEVQEGAVSGQVAEAHLGFPKPPSSRYCGCILSLLHLRLFQNLFHT